MNVKKVFPVLMLGFVLFSRLIMAQPLTLSYKDYVTISVEEVSDNTLRVLAYCWGDTIACLAYKIDKKALAEEIVDASPLVDEVFDLSINPPRNSLDYNLRNKTIQMNINFRVVSGHDERQVNCVLSLGKTDYHSIMWACLDNLGHSILADNLAIIFYNSEDEVISREFYGK